MGNAQSYGEFEKWDIFKLYPGNLKTFYMVTEKATFPKISKKKII